MSEILKECEYCGKEFRTNIQNKKYCTQYCAGKARHQKQAQKKMLKESEVLGSKTEAKDLVPIAEINVIGHQKFIGREISIIEGGFGEGQKIILAKDVAKLHGVEVGYINRLINNHLEEFDKDDLIDLLNASETFRNFAIENGLIGSNRTQNVFLLSQRGYIKLVAMMDNSNQKKWEVMGQLINEYFTMKQELKRTREEELVMMMYKGGSSSILAHRELAKLEVEKATKKLQEEKREIEEENIKLIDEVEKQKPKVDYYDEILKSKDALLVTQIASDYGLSAIKLNKILCEERVQRKVRDQYVLYAEYAGKGYTKSETNIINERTRVQTLWTQKGRLLIHEILKKRQIEALMDREEIVIDLSNFDI